MQHLENDMDDLFQRAGLNYPLKPGKGDWESVAKKLSDNAAAKKPDTGTTTRKRNYLLLLILFLLIFSVGLLGYLLFNEMATGPQKNFLANDLKVGVDNNIRPADETIDLSIPAGKNNMHNLKSKSKRKGLVHANTKGDVNIYSFSSSEAREEPVKQDYFSGNKEINEGKGRYSPADSSGAIKEKNKPSINAAEPGKPGNNDFDQSESPIVNQEKTNKKVSPIRLARKSKWYLGIFAGPDYSRVKEKSFSKTGFNTGILLGYTLNRNLSIESGFSWNKKHFNSNGKNFHMGKMGSAMPAGMVIDDLESRTALIEIPITVKYDFYKKRKFLVFAAAGVSAYIMTKERNMYTVTYNGSQQQMEGIYDNMDYGFPAVANLSFGLEHILSANLKLRIEPYFKIPLQGMGIGSLPVTSAGIHLGITGKLK